VSWLLQLQQVYTCGEMEGGRESQGEVELYINKIFTTKPSHLLAETCNAIKTGSDFTCT